ncbi:MAG TPA: energy transducer TonB [Vicinamibacterales bacterium]|nr:energy transducer TonB [Vicinamibacterales bacterium]
MTRLVVAMVVVLTCAGLQAQTSRKPLLPVRLPGDQVAMPREISRVVPPYPQTTAGGPVDGTVDVEVVVSASGSVLDARVTKPSSSTVDDVCRGAAERWTFEPAVEKYPEPGRSGAVPALVLLRFEFTPPRGDKPGTVSAQLTSVPDREITTDSLGAGTDARPPAKPGEAGIQLPRLLRQVTPSYTNGAMRAKIQGEVQMEVVILADGTVGAARVVKSLDARFGLDQEALHVARHWLFEPGTLDGKPVPVIVTLILSFRLH